MKLKNPIQVVSIREFKDETLQNELYKFYKNEIKNGDDTYLFFYTNSNWAGLDWREHKDNFHNNTLNYLNELGYNIKAERLLIRFDT